MKPEYQRTFRLDRLYHKFLKPENIHIEYLHIFAKKLQHKGFIELLPEDRYSDTPKLADRTNTKELFALIRKFGRGVKNETI